jgi:DNA-binding transcriptional LysR family regulator
MDLLAVMEAFVRVVEAGSFSAAARCLNTGQPAISKSVAQLEDQLGVRLLIRSTRGLTPTEAGEGFYQSARRAIKEADHAVQEARGAGTGFAGRLRVSAPTTFASLHVVPRLPKFLAAHPQLAIDLILDDRVVDLVGEGADIALRMGTLRDSSLVARRIAASRRLVLGAPAYFERAGVPNSPEDLVGHTAVIYMQNGIGDTWTFCQGEYQTSVRISGSLRVTATEGLRAAVLGEMGLAIVSEWMFSPELESGAVRSVLREWSLPTVDLWAVTPTGRMMSAKARAFADFVESEMKGHSRGR